MKKYSCFTVLILSFLTAFYVQNVFPQEKNNYSFSYPEWFSSNPETKERKTFGLVQVNKKTFTLNNKILTLNQETGEVIGAAYYPNKEIIVTVEKNGTTSLYKKEKKQYVLSNRHAVDYKAGVLSLKFTRIPGLIYLLLQKSQDAQNIAKAKYMAQDYDDRYYRIVLYGSAENWHAIPGNDRISGLLTGCYIVKDKIVSLSLKEKIWISLVLPDPLDSPFRSGPYDVLAEAIFIFPEKGIICKTINGWSLHQANGELLKWFSSKNIYHMWWGNPSHKYGNFFIHSRIGPSGKTYMMDIKKGKLVAETFDKNEREKTRKQINAIKLYYNKIAGIKSALDLIDKTADDLNSDLSSFEKEIKETDEQFRNKAPADYIKKSVDDINLRANKIDERINNFVKNLKNIQIIKRKKRRKSRTPLERIDISRIKLKAIINNERCLVEDDTRKGYIVGVGTYIGHWGKVTKILEDRIIIEEEIEDMLGNLYIRRRYLNLLRPLNK